MTEKDKMFSGELYDANNDEALLAERAHAKGRCYDFNQLRPSDAAGQRALLVELLGSVGRTARPPSSGVTTATTSSWARTSSPTITSWFSTVPG